MVKVKKLTQRLAETAMPVEVEVPDTATEVNARVAKALRRHGDKRSRLQSIGQLGSLADELEHSPSLTKHRTRYVHDGFGLYLAVSVGKYPGTVNRSWLYRYATGNVIVSKTGKARREQKKIGLGSLDTVSLERARELAEIARRQVQEGHDPLQEKMRKRAQHKIEARKLHSLKQAVDEYVKRHSDAWTPDHTKHWVRSFHHLSKLLDLPVSSIDRAAVVSTIEPFWAQHPNTAMRLRGRLESVLSAAEVWGWRAGENPASWSLLKHSFRPPSQIAISKHHDALPWQDAPEFMRKLLAIEGDKARALELVIRTAARTSEVLFAMPEEFTADTWRIPPERTKTGKRNGDEHVVPLTSSMIACLRKIDMTPRQPLFRLPDRALWKLSKTIDPRPSVHGWRAVWKTWSGDHGYPREVTEMQLQHRIGSRVEQVYNRTTYLQARQQQLEAWNDYLG